MFKIISRGIIVCLCFNLSISFSGMHLMAEEVPVSSQGQSYDSMPYYPLKDFQRVGTQIIPGVILEDQNTDLTDETVNGAANPLAVWAEEQGWEYNIATASDGSQSGEIVISGKAAWDLYAEYQQARSDSDTDNTNVANPLAVWAEEQGWEYNIATASDGSQSGEIVISGKAAWDFYAQSQEQAENDIPQWMQELGITGEQVQQYYDAHPGVYWPGGSAFFDESTGTYKLPDDFWSSIGETPPEESVNKGKLILDPVRNYEPEYQPLQDQNTINSSLEYLAGELGISVADLDVTEALKVIRSWLVGSEEVQIKVKDSQGNEYTLKGNKAVYPGAEWKFSFENTSIEDPGNEQAPNWDAVQLINGELFWPDASRGNAEPGMMYAQVFTPLNASEISAYLNAIGSDMAADIIGTLVRYHKTADAASLVAGFSPEKAAEILLAMDTWCAAVVLDNDEISPEFAAQVLSLMDVSEAVKILNKSINGADYVDGTVFILDGASVLTGKTADILENMDLEKAVDILQQLGFKQAVVKGMDPQFAADILSALGPESAASILVGFGPWPGNPITVEDAVLVMQNMDDQTRESVLSAMDTVNPDKADLIREALGLEAGSWWEGMTTQEMADHLGGLSGEERTEAFLELCDFDMSKAGTALAVMDAEAGAEIIASDKIDVDKAVMLLSMMGPDDAAEIFNTGYWGGVIIWGPDNNNFKLGSIIPDAKAAAILEAMNTTSAGLIFGSENLGAESAARILNAMNEVKAAEILFSLGPILIESTIFPSIRQLVSNAKLADIFAAMDADKAAAVMVAAIPNHYLDYSAIPEGITVPISANNNLARISAILSQMKSLSAARIIDSSNMDVNTAANILSRMDSAKAAGILAVSQYSFPSPILIEDEALPLDSSDITVERETVSPKLMDPGLFILPKEPVISADKAADILEAMDAKSAAEILSAGGYIKTVILTDGDASQTEVSSDAVPEGAEFRFVISEERAAEIMSAMEESSVEVILNAMDTINPDRADVLREALGLTPSWNLPGLIELFDFNGDGKFTQADARYIAEYDVGNLGELSQEELDKMDVNGDGEVNIVDAMVLGHILNFESMDVERQAALLSYVPAEAAVEMLSGIEAEKAVDILSAMDADGAGEIITAMLNNTPQLFNLQSIMQGLSAESAADILSEMDADDVAGLFGGTLPLGGGLGGVPGLVDASKAAQILALMSTEQAVAVLNSDNLSAERAAEILGSVSESSDWVDDDGDQHHTRIWAINGYKSAAILSALSVVNADKAAEIMSAEGISDGLKVSILCVMDAEGAARIIGNDNLSAEAASGLLQRVSYTKEDHVKDILNALDTVNPDKADLIREALGMPTAEQELITSLYQKILGREPDEQGLKYWTEQYQNGMSLADIAKGFFNSEEFKGMDIKDQVTALYRIILDREPDQGGLEYWVASFNDGIWSLREIAINLCNSSEFNSLSNEHKEFVLVDLDMMRAIEEPSDENIPAWMQELGVTPEKVQKYYDAHPGVYWLGGSAFFDESTGTYKLPDDFWSSIGEKPKLVIDPVNIFEPVLEPLEDQDTIDQALNEVADRFGVDAADLEMTEAVKVIIPGIDGTEQVRITVEDSEGNSYVVKGSRAVYPGAEWEFEISGLAQRVIIMDTDPAPEESDVSPGEIPHEIKEFKLDPTKAADYLSPEEQAEAGAVLGTDPASKETKDMWTTNSIPPSTGYSVYYYDEEGNLLGKKLVGDSINGHTETWYDADGNEIDTALSEEEVIPGINPAKKGIKGLNLGLRPFNGVYIISRRFELELHDWISSLNLLQPRFLSMRRQSESHSALISAQELYRRFLDQ